ncbi:MAG: HAD family hydrolase [Chlamydiota bacterium]|nr:HAD family hydrolase [Chlamydiota bacterium]
MIALDIDGTLTDSTHTIPDRVMDHLTAIEAMNWKIAFITGRILSYALRALEGCPFPYLIGVQNGADILQFPGEHLLKQFYLNGEEVVEILGHFQGVEWLLYGGAGGGDCCYFDEAMWGKSDYDLGRLKSLSRTPWRAIGTWEEIRQMPAFSLIKGIGEREPLEALKERLFDVANIHTICIEDPIFAGHSLLLITHAQANKGGAAGYCREHWGLKNSPLIVAGDDYNDVPLFQVADYTIAMENGITALKERADIIAPPHSEMGIIQGLELAIAHYTC